MPSRYLPADTIQRANAAIFDQNADNDIWQLKTSHEWDQDISDLDRYLLPTPDPLPVVVSPSPDPQAMRAHRDEVARQDQQMSQPAPVAMPSASDADRADTTSSATGVAGPQAASGQPAAMPSGQSVAMPVGGDAGQPAQAAPMQDAGPIDNSSRASFVKTAYPYMLQAAGGDRNLAELMLAKAISENGSIGTGRPFWNNNFSGIKGTGDAGSTEADTWEDYGNGPVNIRAPFAAFSTPQKGMAAFMEFLHDNSRYASALQNYQRTGDASQLIRDIHAAGYATDPIWPEKIESIRRDQVAPVLAGGDIQKLSDTMPADDSGLSPGDQKRAKLAAASGTPQEMPVAPMKGGEAILPAPDGAYDVVTQEPPPLQGQRVSTPINPDDGTIDGPDGTYGVRYWQQAPPRPGTNQPIQNPDGSVTTERSITVTDDRLNGGRATNIPTVWNGKIVSDDEAIDNAARSGIAWPSYASVDDAVRAAEQRSRDLGTGQATSVGGATVPPEVQNALPYRNRAVRGALINEGPDDVQYRQPLAPTMGDTGTGDYDPRDADQGPHEGGQIPWNGSGVSSSGTTSQSTIPPMIPAADGTDQSMTSPATPGASPTARPPDMSSIAPGSPSTYAASQDDPGTASVQPAPQPDQQAQPFTPPSGLQAVYDAGGRFLHWIQGAADAVTTQGPATAIGHGIANTVTRPLLGKPPLPNEGPETPIDRALLETGRSLGANAGNVVQGTQSGDYLQAGLGALGVAGDLAPSMTLARQLNEMLPKADTPLGEIGAGDVIMTAALAHDAARLGYGVIKAGGRLSSTIARAINEGVPAEEFSGWLANGVTGSGAARVVDEAAPVAARVAEEAPTTPQSFRDFSRTLETPATASGELSVLPRQERQPPDQILREEYGRPWNEVPVSPETAAMAEESGSIGRPRNRVSAEDAANLRRVEQFPDMSGRMNATPGVGPSAGIIGDVANSIGGGVGGATIGAGLPAETDEERRRNALIGAGVGMVAGPAAGRLMSREGGALATFGASPNYRPPTAAQIKQAEVQGARRGAMLNGEVKPPPSSVPLKVRAEVATTDVNAGVRWAENLLTDAAGSPRLAIDDPRRPSTQLRVNGGGKGADRVATEMEPSLISAGKAGLQDELPQYLEDTHQKDILDDFYTRGKQAVLDDRAQKIAAAQQRGASPQVIQRMQAKAQADAEAAGEAALHKREGQSASMTYPQIEARLQAQEQRVKATGGDAWQTLQDAAQAVWDHNAQTRQRMVDANLVDPVEAADWAQRFPHWVPTVPLSHLGVGGRTVPAASSRAFSGSRAGIIRELDDVQTAGERLNPIVASRNATIKAEQMIQRNNVGQALGQLVDDAANVNPKAVEVGADHKTFLGGGTDITYTANGQPVTLSVPKSIADGLTAATNLGMPANTADGITRFLMHTQSAALTAGRMAFIPKNIRRDLDSYLTNTMAREGGPQHIGPIMSAWLKEAGNALSDIVAAQWNPRAGVGALVGGVTGATTGDPNDTPGQRARRAAEFALGGVFLGGANKVPVSGRALDFLARGGEVGNVSTSLASGQRWYHDVMRSGGVPVRTPGEMAAFLKDWGSDILSLQGIKGINERTELISKTAAMRRAEAGGAGPVQSMVAGRDVTYDPDIGGTMVRQMNTYVQFMNAMTQGGAQFYRLWRNHPVEALASAATVIAPVMLAAEAWNRSDPQRAAAYDNVPQYAKDAGVVWMLPWAGSDTRSDRPQYIVDPTELSTPVVVALRGAVQNLDKIVPGLQPNAGRTDVPADASDVGQWAAVLNEALSIFHPLRGDSPGGVVAGMVPPGLREGVSLYQNKDLSTGAPIAPDNASDLAGANARATAASQRIAGAANATGRAVNDYTPAKPLGDYLQSIQPAQVEYGLRKIAPAYGDIVTGTSDAVAPGPYKQAEQGRPANEPIVGYPASAFVKDTPGGNLERAQNQAMTQGVREVLSDAGMRPDQAQLNVGTTYKQATLTRDEQLRWQEATNQMLARDLPAARRDPKWRSPATRQEAVSAAIAQAKQDAADQVLRNLTDAVIQQRQRAEQSRQRELVAR